MKIFYHGDLDGRAAARILYERCTETEIILNKSDFIEMQYNIKFPIESIEINEVVYIVDFSIKPDEMRELLKVTKNIEWIDHHITAIKEYINEKISVGGHQLVSIDGIKRSGAWLAYDYIHGPYNPHTVFPKWIEYVSDFDTWTHSDPNSMLFKLGSDLYDQHPYDGDLWPQISKDINHIILAGEVISRYTEQTNTEYLENYSYEVLFEGYKCLVCNRRSNSSLFSEKINQYDMVIPFCFNGKEWILSLFSLKDNVHCGEIAKKYGGGGHKGAAGFHCKELPFVRSDAS